MGATNETPNLKLSQFVQSDHATWYGDYNGDMLKIDDAYGRQSGISETLTEQVGTNTNDISAMKQNINGLQNGLNSTNVAVQQTQSRVTTLETEQGVTDNRLTNLEDDVSSLMSNDQWVIVGDSYGAGSTNNYMSTLTALNPNRTIHNVCSGGAGFTVTSNSFLQNLQNAVTSITNPNRVSKILAIGGAGDLNASKSEIETAINTFYQYCIATYQNAQVFVGYLYGESSPSTQNTAKKRNGIVSYKSGAVKSGATYFNGIECVCNQYSDYYPGVDSYHPNAYGCKEIGGFISAFMNNESGVNLTTEVKESLFTYDSSLTSGNNTKIRCRISNNLGFLDADYFRFNKTEEIPAFTWFTLGTIAVDYLNPSNYKLPDVEALDQTNSVQFRMSMQLVGNALQITNNNYAIPAGANVTFDLQDLVFDLSNC